MTDRDDATLSFLSRRRSWPPRMLAEPAPDDAALNELLTIALRVPDHAKLEPWRLIVMRREALDRLRPSLTAAAEAQGMDEAGVKKTVSALDSPLIVAVFTRRPKASISRQSAGTWSPSSSRITSPGTSRSTSNTCA